jgi:4-alpha-glucanotransferase
MTERVLDRRRAGVLLHPTSLITAGRGALGAAAREVIDWLARAGFAVWQILPLGPPGGGGSPYWARSDFAGNLAMLDRAELPDLAAQRSDYDAFRQGSRDWLDDYVLFEHLAEQFHRPWWEWPPELRGRQPQALERVAREQGAALEQRRVEQWYFDWQWRALRRYAQQRGVRLFGDLPIYVAPDSVSTWAQPQQFRLQPDGRPALLAGVPPDYFSADGQLWGNPLYDWQRALGDQFAFWRARFARQLRRFDLVRIDHFRGLAAYWAVPAGARTAREGRWEPAPGEALFKALESDHPYLPVVAEDLGVITADVDALRRGFGMPGMRVLQFGFDGSGTNPHLPHNYATDVVAYAGTHDNDTTLGWYRSLSDQDRERVDFYLRTDAGHVLEDMMRATLGSVAQLAILSAQDLLQLGSDCRFNTPGTADGNWTWCLPQDALTQTLAQEFGQLNHVYGRVPPTDWQGA